MFNTIVAPSTRATTCVFVAWFAVTVGVLGARTALSQQPARPLTKQQRDSVARADSARHSMAGMPGMKGHAQPAKPATPKTSQAPSSKPSPKAKTAGMSPGMSMGGKTRPNTAQSRAARSDKRIPVKKEAGNMAGMRHMSDSSSTKAMAPMPGMSPMRDTAHAMSNMKPDSSRDTTSMQNMPAMRGRGRDTSMSAMPGMNATRDTSRRDSSMKAMPSMPSMPSMPGMASGDTSQMKGMAMVPEPLGVSMERMGSGTTWIPDAVPLPSRHFMAGKWDMMLHGFVFGLYDKQGGSRGQSQGGSLNWGMFMASHELAGGRFQARTMLSLDPWTVTPRGYPLLLQSGESFHGEPLHDRQHPHDFWMELGALYERAITRRVGIEAYVAPSGEPALGPVAFMHRPSAMDNPFAPIGHHWQDATHISFGVVTAGLFTHDWKLEGSVFNGREPNENRWDFDPLKLDSYSGRLSYNPSTHWALSAGYGFLKSPEALAPTESVHRITASAIYGTSLGPDGQVATTVVWGANKNSAHPDLSHAALIESEAILDKSNTLLGRAEYAQKSAEDLALDTPQFGFAPETHFAVSSISLGYIREVAHLRGATFGLGAMGTLNMVPSSLKTAYGSRTPVGGVVFLRLRPTLQRGALTGMGSMHMDHARGDSSPNRVSP